MQLATHLTLGNVKEVLLYPLLGLLAERPGYQHLMVAVAQADCLGSGGSRQDGRHGVHVNKNVGYALQDQLLVHDSL